MSLKKQKAGSLSAPHLRFAGALADEKMSGNLNLVDPCFDEKQHSNYRKMGIVGEISMGMILSLIFCLSLSQKLKKKRVECAGDVSMGSVLSIYPQEVYFILENSQATETIRLPFHCNSGFLRGRRMFL